MPTMFFKSAQPSDKRVRPKCFGFDSSPGRAIGQALSPGNYDESSYEATLKSSKNGVSVYSIRMRLKETETRVGTQPMHHVGEITHTPSYLR